MRIFSWNVNGLRAVLRKEALQSFLKQEKPDVLCLQEVKANPEQVDFNFSDYNVFWNSAERAGYSGTAILVRKDLKNVVRFNGWMDFPELMETEADEIAKREGRILVLDFGNFYLTDVYTTNSKPDLSRLNLREKKWDP